MSTTSDRITPQEYLIRERQSSEKSEFYQGEIFAMGGGSANHSLIAANFVREAGNALKGRPCAVFNSDLRVQVRTTGLYTYPDATIVCGEQEFDDDQRDTLINPTVIIEVLSDSTEKYDRGKKSNHYRRIAFAERTRSDLPGSSKSRTIHSSAERRLAFSRAARPGGEF